MNTNKIEIVIILQPAAGIMINERMSNRRDEWINEQTNERTNEQTNELIEQRKKKWQKSTIFEHSEIVFS